MWTLPAGGRERFRVGATADLVPRIDALRAELRNPMAIAAGDVPQLQAFVADWGAAFIAPLSEQEMPDVLVIVPHGPTHDLPFHLVDVQEQPLGARVGVSYASSRSLFIRSVDRNPARQREPAQSGAGHRSVMSGGTDIIGGLDDEFEAICRLVADRFSGERTLFLSGKFPYSRTAVKAAVRSSKRPAPSVLCVMAHGWIDDDNHRMSGLLVDRDPMGVSLRAIPLHGGRYFDFRDLPLRRPPARLKAVKECEVLTAAELEIDAQIDCELVMLLGCSAGWGRVLQGDEPASLAETWLKIGAASVVAPLWDAPIAAVREWTDAFLHAWTTLDLPKALAHRHATQRLMQGAFRDAPERLGVMTLRGDWL